MLVVVKKPISYLRSNVEKRNDKKKELPDNRHYKLKRLHTLITMENYLIGQLKDIPHWNTKNTRQLIMAIDQSIDGEIKGLCHINITDLPAYHP